jgi:ribosomal RNA assembly protein
MECFRAVVKIPKERIGVLRKFSKEIERIGKVKIEINSEVVLSGDSMNVYLAKNVVIAIGRGFDFEEASKLFKDYILYVIPISKNKNTLVRIRGRIIGRKGKIKKIIEELTNTKISIYGKTVSVIGKGEGLNDAVFVLNMLISGKSHSYIINFLKKRRYQRLEER